jgi:acyl-CoA hydrolase
MTSINAALQIDFYDQANASHVRGQIYSGFGGSTDFIVGALHSRGGGSYMALPSWHPKADLSSIVPRLTENVTSFQHSNAAHPDAREELIQAASEFGLI